MRAILAALLLTAACTTTDSLTDLGELATDGKNDVQAIKVPLKLAPGETAEFALTADGPFQAKAVYTQSASVTIKAGEAQASGVQPSLVIEAPRTPTEYVLEVTNTSSVELKGTFEIGKAAPSCGDEIWLGWFDTLATKLTAVGSVIDQDERRALDTLATSRPCQSSTDGAYARWHQVFDAKLAASGSVIDQDEKLHLDLRLSAQPRPTSAIDGYLAWTRELRPILTGAGSVIDQDERGRMETLIKGKACAPATGETLAAWNTLAAGAPGEASALLAAARPDAGCS